MKKLLVSLLFVTLVLSSCSGDSQTQTQAPSEQTTTQAPTTAATASPTEAPAKESYELGYSKFSAWETSIGTINYTIIAELSNTGDVPLYLSSSTFDIEDSDGKLIMTVENVSAYPEIILPGEKAYFFRLGNEDTLVPEQETSIVPHVKVTTAKNEQILFPITDLQTKDDSTWGLRAIGRVENNTGEEQSLVTVAVVVFETGGEPLAVLTDIITEIASGDKVGFEAGVMGRLPKTVTTESIGEIKAFAYPMQFQF